MDLRRLASNLRPNEQRAMATHVAWIGRSVTRPGLEPLTPPELEALATVLPQITPAEDEPVLDIGAEPDRAFIVREGEVELSVDEHGRLATVGRVRAGGSFGEIPMLCDLEVPFRAVALAGSILLRVDRARVPELMAAQPDAGLRWLTNAVRRLEYANRRIVGLTIGDLRRRVLSVLADEVAIASEHKIPITQTELAALLGATRQSINRVIGGLAREGIVRQRYGVVEILDEPKLLSLASEV